MGQGPSTSVATALQYQDLSLPVEPSSCDYNNDNRQSYRMSTPTSGSAFYPTYTYIGPPLSPRTIGTRDDGLLVGGVGDAMGNFSRRSSIYARSLMGRVASTTHRRGAAALPSKRASMLSNVGKRNSAFSTSASSLASTVPHGGVASLSGQRNSREDILAEEEWEDIDAGAGDREMRRHSQSSDNSPASPKLLSPREKALSLDGHMRSMSADAFALPLSDQVIKEADDSDTPHEPVSPLPPLRVTNPSPMFGRPSSRSMARSSTVPLPSSGSGRATPEERGRASPHRRSGSSVRRKSPQHQSPSRGDDRASSRDKGERRLSGEAPGASSGGSPVRTKRKLGKRTHNREGATDHSRHSFPPFRSGPAVPTLRETVLPASPPLLAQEHVETRQTAAHEAKTDATLQEDDLVSKTQANLRASPFSWDQSFEQSSTLSSARVPSSLGLLGGAPTPSSRPLTPGIAAQNDHPESETKLGPSVSRRPPIPKTLHNSDPNLPYPGSDARHTDSATGMAQESFARAGDLPMLSHRRTIASELPTMHAQAETEAKPLPIPGERPTRPAADPYLAVANYPRASIASRRPSVTLSHLSTTRRGTKVRGAASPSNSSSFLTVLRMKFMKGRIVFGIGRRGTKKNANGRGQLELPEQLFMPMEALRPGTPLSLSRASTRHAVGTARRAASIAHSQYSGRSGILPQSTRGSMASLRAMYLANGRASPAIVMRGESVNGSRPAQMLTAGNWLKDNQAPSTNGTPENIDIDEQLLRERRSKCDIIAEERDLPPMNGSHSVDGPSSKDLAPAEAVARRRRPRLGQGRTRRLGSLLGFGKPTVEQPTSRTVEINNVTYIIEPMDDSFLAQPCGLSDRLSVRGEERKSSSDDSAKKASATLSPSTQPETSLATPPRPTRQPPLPPDALPLPQRSSSLVDESAAAQPAAQPLYSARPGMIMWESFTARAIQMSPDILHPSDPLGEPEDESLDELSEHKEEAISTSPAQELLSRNPSTFTALTGMSTTANAHENIGSDDEHDRGQADVEPLQSERSCESTTTVRNRTSTRHDHVEASLAALTARKGQEHSKPSLPLAKALPMPLDTEDSEPTDEMGFPPLNSTLPAFDRGLAVQKSITRRHIHSWAADGLPSVTYTKHPRGRIVSLFIPAGSSDGSSAGDSSDDEATSDYSEPASPPTRERSLRRSQPVPVSLSKASATELERDVDAALERAGYVLRYLAPTAASRRRSVMQGTQVQPTLIDAAPVFTKTDIVEETVSLVVAQPEPVQESSDIAAAAPLIQINNSDEVVQMPNVAPELSVSPSETLSSPLSSRPSGSPDLDELIRKQKIIAARLAKLEEQRRIRGQTQISEPAPDLNCNEQAKTVNAPLSIAVTTQKALQLSAIDQTPQSPVDLRGRSQRRRPSGPRALASTIAALTSCEAVSSRDTQSVTPTNELQTNNTIPDDASFVSALDRPLEQQKAEFNGRASARIEEISSSAADPDKPMKRIPPPVPEKPSNLKDRIEKRPRKSGFTEGDVMQWKRGVRQGQEVPV